MRLATAWVRSGAISCMSARRFAIVTDSWWPLGRSATRSRIGSGRVSWRRRLCARLGVMPRSAQTARTRSSSGRPARACQQSANCCCWSRRLSSSRWLAWAWMRLISSGVGSWSSSRTIRRAHRRESFEPVGAGELVAGLGGEQPALSVVEEHGRLVGVGAVADARDQLPGAHQQSGERVDAVVGDVLAGVGCELEILERDALDACPRRVPWRRW